MALVWSLQRPELLTLFGDGQHRVIVSTLYGLGLESPILQPDHPSRLPLGKNITGQGCVQVALCITLLQKPSFSSRKKHCLCQETAGQDFTMKPAVLYNSALAVICGAKC